MKEKYSTFYRSPIDGKKLDLEVTEKQSNERQSDEILSGQFITAGGDTFDIKDGVPDLTWPRQLAEIDQETRDTYDRLAEEYDKFADFPFRTYRCSQDEIREKMTDQLNITDDAVVLEIGAGDGRGSEFIAQRLGPAGKLFVQELSPAFLNKAIQRLEKYTNTVDIEYAIANAVYLSFDDNTFDAAHHFGGINTFSDPARCLKEMARVVKPGGKIVVGDESMGPWLRETEFGKIMMNSNPLLKYEIPFNELPVEARDVKVEWIMMGAFFVLEFTVGVGEPQPDYHIPIPSERGGTHWSRYFGHLEGISDETKKLAYEARKKSNKSMHEWLDEVVSEAAKRELEEVAA